jgi:hypothetical protein
MMSGRPRAISALEIVAASQVQQICGSQVGDRISPALFVNQQRKSDARLFPENSCIVPVTKSDGGQRRALSQKGLLVLAQLRDVLTAKNSPVVPEKNEDGWLLFPQRTQADFFAISVGKNDVCELLAEGFLHVEPSLGSRHSSVNALGLRRPMVGKIRRQLRDKKFLNQIGDRSSADPDSLVFKYQSRAAIFRRVIKVRNTARSETPEDS